MSFALGDQPFHFAEQIGNADLVVEVFGDRYFEVLNFTETNGWICGILNQ